MTPIILTYITYSQILVVTYQSKDHNQIMDSNLLYSVIVFSKNPTYLHNLIYETHLNVLYE